MDTQQHALEQTLRKTYQLFLIALVLQQLNAFKKDANQNVAHTRLYEKALNAAEAFNLIKGNDLSGCDLHRLDVLVRYEASYISGILRNNLLDKTCEEQSVVSPVEYEDFLRGVFETHRGHARIFAELSELQNSLRLVDIGGGLGAFALAWINANPDRSVTLLDLPQAVATFLRSPEYLSSPRDRIMTGAIDLRTDFELPQGGDVYLLSNILHLFDDWERILDRTAVQIPSGKSFVLIEAVQDGSPESKIFDLSLHIRGGAHGSLVDLSLVQARLASGWDIEVIPLKIDEYDYFSRRYNILVAKKN